MTRGFSNLRKNFIFVSFIPILLSIGFIPAFSSEANSQLSEVSAIKETICSLTNVKPYYDCSEKWALFLSDTEFPIYCNENVSVGIASKGCTTYTTFRGDVVSATIHLGNEHGSQTSYPYPNGPQFQTVLYHELQHTICGCTWHSEIAHDFIN